MTLNKNYDHTITYKIDRPDLIKADVLDPIASHSRQQRDITIRIRQPEFTAVCPMTGLPDFGTVEIQYVPGERIVELKSLKYYLMQYRQVGVFYEHVVVVILDHLVKLLEPRTMTVTIRFTPRGGLTTSVTATHPDPT